VGAQARIELRGAADRASSLGSYSQAIGYLEEALDVTQDVRDRAELLERAAVAAEADAQYERGINFARQAAASYSSVTDPIGAGRVSGRLGTLFVGLSRLAEAIEVLSGALAGLPADSDELRAELSARLSRVYMRARQD